MGRKLFKLAVVVALACRLDPSLQAKVTATWQEARRVASLAIARVEAMVPRPADALSEPERRAVGTTLERPTLTEVLPGLARMAGPRVPSSLH